MMNKLMKKVLLFSCLVMVIVPFFGIDTVYAGSSFTTCTVSEPSYLRDTPGGTPLKDVDGISFLLKEPRRLEVIDTTNSGGKEYKKIRTNYYSNNYEGWIYSGYLKDFKTYTLDDNYAQTLRNSGFPETYIAPLQKLHAVYPNWSFTPVKNGNGLDWNTAVSEEYSPVYKNLINSKDTTLLSTDGAAYTNGVYKEFEPGWYAPSKQTIAFYMDPRNWLTETTVFMFEQLSYNSTLHNADTVQQILNGTFMSGSYNYNGSTISYANTFVDVGKQRNVSPVQLASKVLQEQGSTGSATINMQSGGQTYHNFFNINAYGSTTEQIVSNALATAKNNGWTSPYTSILGGSSVISNGYNNVGQDTVYYQKFNTINNNSLYWNQYMANVRALPSESFSIYSSYYSSGLLNKAFSFKIPVYNSMPDATTLSLSENSENTLKSLSVTSCNLNPSFNSAATSYTCNVPAATNNVTVSATKTSSYSSMKGTGTISLNSSTTTANVEVTASNGEKKTYTITINKLDADTETPSDIISGLGYNLSSNYVSGIELGTDASNVIANVTNNYNLASITIKNKDGNIKSSGVLATGDSIIILSNNQTGTYKVVIKGDVNGDGKISMIDFAKVKDYILGELTLTGEYFKSADISNDGKISMIDFAKIKDHILNISTIIK